ncbi:uncharacterized protein LOC118229845 [Anguilla anguilla]|uniref:uncharacterized protein LOC118229845 n=1 Tax=Anguilla anguilla TaxID=7936 RepID=UPI0015A97C05|nr:uncharacterized protein LOC118229845 [Anguilla anguilla]
MEQPDGALADGDLQLHPSPSGHARVTNAGARRQTGDSSFRRKLSQSRETGRAEGLRALTPFQGATAPTVPLRVQYENRKPAFQWSDVQTAYSGLEDIPGAHQLRGLRQILVLRINVLRNCV